MGCPRWVTAQPAPEDSARVRRVGCGASGALSTHTPRANIPPSYHVHADIRIGRYTSTHSFYLRCWHHNCTCMHNIHEHACKLQASLRISGEFHCGRTIHPLRAAVYIATCTEGLCDAPKQNGAAGPDVWVAPCGKAAPGAPTHIPCPRLRAAGCYYALESAWYYEKNMTTIHCSALCNRMCVPTGKPCCTQDAVTYAKGLKMTTQ